MEPPIPPSTDSTDVPAPAGIAGMKPFKHGHGVVQRENCACNHGEKHDADKHLHDLLETLEAAKHNEGETNQRVKDSPPACRYRTTRKIGDAETARIAERARHGGRPEDEVDAEVCVNPPG